MSIRFCLGFSHKQFYNKLINQYIYVCRAIPYETWLEHTRYVKLVADNELADTARMREALFVMRERARNDLRAQQECTEYTLRKRVYETQRARNELQYQSEKVFLEEFSYSIYF